MKSIKILSCLILFSCVVLYSCSKENIDEMNENQNPFNPGVEEVLLVDSGTWTFSFDTTLLRLDTMRLNISDTCKLADSNFGWYLYAWDLAINGDRFRMKFCSPTIDLGIYEVHDFWVFENIPPYTSHHWGNTQTDIQVEVLEVGDIGEPVSGTFSGKLINDDGSEIMLNGGFNHVLRHQ